MLEAADSFLIFSTNSLVTCSDVICQYGKLDLLKAFILAGEIVMFLLSQAVLKGKPCHCLAGRRWLILSSSWLHGSQTSSNNPCGPSPSWVIGQFLTSGPFHSTTLMPQTFNHVYQPAHSAFFCAFHLDVFTNSEAEMDFGRQSLLSCSHCLPRMNSLFYP